MTIIYGVSIIQQIRDHWGSGENKYPDKLQPFFRNGATTKIIVKYNRFLLWGSLLSKGYKQEELEKHFKQWIYWRFPNLIGKVKVEFKIN